MKRLPKALLFSLLLVASCCTGERESFFAMDTMVELVSVGADGWTEQAALKRAREAIEDVERWADSRNPEAEVFQLNQRAGEGPVTVSAALARILETSIEVAEDSNGAFDPTVLPLILAYGFGGENQGVPDAEELQAVLSYVDYRQVKLGENSVEIPSGFALDLGGVAKGYAADEALRAMWDAGAEAGLVNIGGDIAVFGERPGGGPWRVGVQHPRAPGELFAVLTLENEAVATSGDYERYFIEDDVRYHHLLDPKTGLPARELVSVTVVAPSCVLADAYATAVFILGHNEGFKHLEANDSLEGMLILEEDGLLKHITTEGFPVQIPPD
ncbi:FAD:protein FMN transferase [bacterium]|nr:FAD:protein FMN transferase [bacterium]